MMLRTLIGVTLGLSLACSTQTDASSIYLKERVNALGDNSNTPFPQEKTSDYVAHEGYPNHCDVSDRYSPTPLDACTASAKVLIQQAIYPAIFAHPLYPTNFTHPLPGAIFTQSGDWGVDPANSNYYRYWNLLASAAGPGWVYIDKATGRYLQFAVLAKNIMDDANVGNEVGNDFKIYYRVSTDGGVTFPNHVVDFKPVFAAGYNVLHPFPDVYVGRDGVKVSGTGTIQKSLNGDVLAPITITDGPPPSNVTSLTNAYVLRGQWTSAGTDVTWSISEPAHLPAAYSTRGADEPAVYELSTANTGNVNCVMVVRASNELSGSYNPLIAGHHWLFRSKDGCATWDGDPVRLSYTDGKPFYAPAANSSLFRSPRDNRLYWVGAISAGNSKGNWPRTRLVSAELDVQSSAPGIVRDSVTVLDERYGQDTDQLQLNNGQLDVQADGSAFLFLRRSDGNTQGPYSWYTLDVAPQEGVTLAVTPTGSSTHLLSWQVSAQNVARYHVRRRYLSGAPHSDLWRQIGTVPGTSTSLTLSGYENWHEAEYEVVAELASGTALRSNHVVARFGQWQGPRLSFTFPTESAPGDAPPVGTLRIEWTYDQAQPLTTFRLHRRYFTQPASVTTCTQGSGTAMNWAVVGDINASVRGVTLGGYNETDRFELQIEAVRPNVASVWSNIVSVHFPAKDDKNRCPY